MHSPILKCFSILIVTLILSGCASQPLKTIPLKQRQTVRFERFRDLTSQYQHLHPAFEILATAALARDFVVVPNYEKFTEHEYDVSQIPLRVADDSTQQLPHFLINGDVERISYEPAKDIDERITTYSLFGLLGLRLLGNDTDMAVFLQYRFYVLGHDSTPIDTFVVYGIAAGDPSSATRDLLAQRANRNAACLFTSQLVERLTRKGFLHPETARYLPQTTPGILEQCAN